MASSSIQVLRLTFANVNLVGETMEAFLARKRFLLAKFVPDKAEPEFHSDLWLSGHVLTWADSGKPEKNGFRMSANTIRETDPVKIDIQPPPGGWVRLSINFEAGYAFIDVREADGARVAYLIVLK